MVMRLLLPGTLTAGKKAVLHIVADDPGLVELTYSGPITGPSQVTIPGARQYRYGGNPAGQYAARLLSANQGQDRNPASWIIRLRPEDIAGAVSYLYNWVESYYAVPIVTCARVYDTAPTPPRINWQIGSVWAFGYAAASYRVAYPLWASPNDASLPTLYSPPGIEYGNAIDYTLAAVQVVSGGSLVRYMLNATGGVQTNSVTCNPTGTMGGTEVIFAQWPFAEFIKYSRALTAAEASNYLLYGTIPSDPQIAYLGGHEIDGPQRVYDSGPMGLHLGEADLSVYPGNGFGAPSCAHRYIETSPVQPVAVEIEVEGAGNATITAKRTRVGVPTSRPDSERFETATANLLVEPVSVSKVYLGPALTLRPERSVTAVGELLVATAAPVSGDATISVVPSTGLIVPSTVELAEGAGIVVATATAPGTYTVTATIEGKSASATVKAVVDAKPAKAVTILEAIDEWLKGIQVRPPFVPADVADVRGTHAARRSYARYVLAAEDPPAVLGAIQYRAQVVVAYETAEEVDADIRLLSEVFSNHEWPALQIEGSITTGFEAGYVSPKIVLDITAIMRHTD